MSMGLICGMSRKETLLAFPGEVFDLFELYLRGHGVKKNKREDD